MCTRSAASASTTSCTSSGLTSGPCVFCSRKRRRDASCSASLKVSETSWRWACVSVLGRLRSAVIDGRRLVGWFELGEHMSRASLIEVLEAGTRMPVV